MKKIKIILAIFLAFWISIFLKNTVFLANTPKIRPFLAQHFIESLTNFYQNRLAKKEIKEIPGNFISNFSQSSLNNEEKKEIPGNFISNFSQSSLNNEEKKEIIDIINKKDYYPITKGIYAKETKEKSIIIIKQDEINWKVYQYEVNGKKISIKVPEGQELPPREEVEEVFK